MRYSQQFTEKVAEYTNATTDEKLEIELHTRIEWFHGLLSAFSNHFPLTGKRFFDIGCGTGCLAVAAHEGGMQVVATDFSQIAVDISKARFAEHQINIEVFQSDIRTPTFGKQIERFDLVTCFQVLEHIPRDGQFQALKNMATLVAPGGYLFIDTENSLFPYDRHDTRLPLVRLLGGEFAQNIVGSLGRGLNMYEPSFSGPTDLHDYLSYDEVIGATNVLGFDLVDPYMPHGTAQQMFRSMTGSDWFYQTFARFIPVERFMPITMLLRKRGP